MSGCRPPSPGRPRQPAARSCRSRPRRAPAPAPRRHRSSPARPPRPAPPARPRAQATRPPSPARPTTQQVRDAERKRHATLGSCRRSHTRTTPPRHAQLSSLRLRTQTPTGDFAEDRRGRPAGHPASPSVLLKAPSGVQEGFASLSRITMTPRPAGRQGGGERQPERRVRYSTDGHIRRSGMAPDRRIRRGADRTALHAQWLQRKAARNSVLLAWRGDWQLTVTGPGPGPGCLVRTRSRCSPAGRLVRPRTR